MKGALMMKPQPPGLFKFDSMGLVASAFGRHLSADTFVANLEECFNLS